MPKLIIGGVNYGAYPTDTGDISYDNTNSRLSALYGVGSGYFRISAHEANVRYYGQITYLTD